MLAPLEAYMTTPETPGKSNEGHPAQFQIQIDRAHFTVTKPELTGAELRNLPAPPIGADRDLFEVVPGQADRKIGNDEKVRMRNGQRFFSAPALINPGFRDL
jgi:hypothetical protein